MAPQTISVIGTLNVDLIVFTDRIPDKGETVVANDYFEGLGGKGANAAIAAYRTCHKKPPPSTGETGIPFADSTAESTTVPAEPNPHRTINEDIDNDIQVRMVGAVGDDKYADFFHKELNKNGVDTSGLSKIEGKVSNIGFGIVEQYSGDNRALPCPVAARTHKEEDFLTVESLAPNGPRPDLIIAQMEIRPGVVQQMIETAGKNQIEFLLNAAPGYPVSIELYPVIIPFMQRLLVVSRRTLNCSRLMLSTLRTSWSMKPKRPSCQHVIWPRFIAIRGRKLAKSFWTAVSRMLSSLWVTKVHIMPLQQNAVMYRRIW